MTTTYYSEEHEWVTVDGDTATMGITKFAAEQMGDVVFVDQQDTGTGFQKGDEIGAIESVKVASEIYAPVDGEIVAVNSDLADNPGTLNEDPEGAAWIYKIKISDDSQLADLMDRKAYDDMTG